jgi:hypothetical protein
MGLARQHELPKKRLGAVTATATFKTQRCLARHQKKLMHSTSSIRHVSTNRPAQQTKGYHLSSLETKASQPNSTPEQRLTPHPTSEPWKPKTPTVLRRADKQARQLLTHSSYCCSRIQLRKSSKLGFGFLSQPFVKFCAP